MGGHIPGSERGIELKQTQEHEHRGREEVEFVEPIEFVLLDPFANGLEGYFEDGDGSICWQGIKIPNDELVPWTQNVQNKR